jgi:DNA-binding transcriptional ArsR family regulator
MTTPKHLASVLAVVSDAGGSPVSVRHIEDETEKPYTTVYSHLRQLVKLGLVERVDAKAVQPERRRNVQVLYRVARQPVTYSAGEDEPAAVREPAELFGTLPPRRY